MNTRRPFSRLLVLVLFGMGPIGCATLYAERPTHTQAESRAITLQIAEIMATSRMYDTAVPLLREGLHEDPNNAKLHRLLGIVLRDRNVFDQAETELAIAEALDPADADTAAAMGVLNDQLGRSDVAEIWHRRALDINPRRGDLFNNLGFSLYLLGRDHAAVVAFREALRHNPNQPRAFNNLGFALARLGDLTAAEQAFVQAGGRAMAQASLGVAYEMAGQTSEAERCYREALRLDNQLQTARKNLKAIASARREGSPSKEP